MVPRLAQDTVQRLRACFATYGHNPSRQMWEGIEHLVLCLQSMADGQAEGGAYYLSSLDPGVGKTQTVIQFLSALLASPQHSKVGAVVFMFTAPDALEAQSVGA